MQGMPEVQLTPELTDIDAPLGALALRDEEEDDDQSSISEFMISLNPETGDFVLVLDLSAFSAAKRDPFVPQLFCPFSRIANHRDFSRTRTRTTTSTRTRI